MAVWSIWEKYTGLLLCWTVVFTPIGTTLSVVLARIVAKNHTRTPQWRARRRTNSCIPAAGVGGQPADRCGEYANDTQTEWKACCVVVYAKGVRIDDMRFDDPMTRGEVFALLDRIVTKIP
nr:hypothetical protein [uncultured Agathobaculum sp.]